MNMHTLYAIFFKNTSLGIVTRWIRHLTAGGVGTLIYMGLVAFFVEVTFMHPVVSVVFAFIILEIYTYAINRLWVYETKKSHLYVIPRFLTVTIIALLLNTSIMYISVELMNLSYWWGLIATALVVPATNFLLNFFWAFR